MSATNTIFSIFNDLFLLYKKYATLEIDTIIFRGDINRYKADNLTIVINLHVFAFNLIEINNRTISGFLTGIYTLEIIRYFVVLGIT